MTWAYGRPVWVLAKTETEQVLLDHLAANGIHVERQVELVDFHADPDAVTCTLRHADGRTEQVRTRYLAGCDGAASTVRRGAGIPFQGGAYPQTFALADLEVDGDLDADAAHAFLGQTGLLLCSRRWLSAACKVAGLRRGSDAHSSHHSSAQSLNRRRARLGSIQVPLSLGPPRW